MSLQASDQAAAAVATHPRVTLADIEGAIASRYYVSGAEAVDVNNVEPLRLLSICILVMKNGFTVIGKSAPASPENYNRELGMKFAYEDAVRQIWPLMGFALRDKLAGF